jgi:hypothetical protein
MSRKGGSLNATLDPIIASLLDELQAGIASVMGDEFVGLYLFGSLVYGDFTDGVSDVDLLAVSRNIATDADIDQLREMHHRFAERHPAWEGRIEVAYQSLHGLKTFQTKRSPMGIISPGEPIHLIEAGDDWLINWYFVLDHGVTIAGPPPETIIAPISQSQFVESARAQARWWGQRIRSVKDQRGESYAILTASRALYTHRTGEHVSKLKSARWVQATYPEWTDLLEMALKRRVAWEADNPVDTFDETVRFIEMVNREISDSPDLPSQDG